MLDIGSFKAEVPQGHSKTSWRVFAPKQVTLLRHGRFPESDRLSFQATTAQARSPVRKWSGQIQFSEIFNGQAVQMAYSVPLLLAEFTADGKVGGVSADNGCHLLGVWLQGPQTLEWLDITLSGCSYGGLNRRYHGSLILARPNSSGQLAVQAIGTPFSPATDKAFDLKGTLRR